MALAMGWGLKNELFCVGLSTNFEAVGVGLFRMLRANKCIFSDPNSHVSIFHTLPLLGVMTSTRE